MDTDLKRPMPNVSYAARRADDMPVLWVRAIRDIGFPASVALLLLWQMLFQLPRETDRIVTRLSAMEMAYQKQTDALLQLLTRFAERK